MMPKKLYKSGFEYINAPMGSTGHVSCPVWIEEIIGYEL
jgi:putative acetyltransferase